VVPGHDTIATRRWGVLVDKWEMGRYAEAHKQQMWGKGFLRFFVLWGLGYGD